MDIKVLSSEISQLNMLVDLGPLYIFLFSLKAKRKNKVKHDAEAANYCLSSWFKCLKSEFFDH